MIIKIFSSLILILNFEILAQEYNYLKPSRDGIGKFYLDREISKVMGHLGASWLERNTREKEENSKLLVKNLNLNKEMVVADIGAGTGYYTSRMAKLSKLVYAVEIQQEMLILNKKNMLKNGIENVEHVLCNVKDPKLPLNSIDLAIFVDVYHELEYPFEVITNLKKYLKPNGVIVLVEFRMEDKFLNIKKLHKMSKKQIIKEMEYVGFTLDKTFNRLPIQHMLFFKKNEA